MKSVPLALTWECWSRSRTAPLLALGICVSVVALFYSAFFHLQSQLTAEDLSLFHGMLFAAVVPIVVIYASVLAGVPDTRFALPISTWSLVGWPMFNGCAATAASYLLLLLFANTCFDAQWPLPKPLIAAVCIYALSHSVSWIPECGRLRIAISLVSGSCFAIMTVGLFSSCLFSSSLEQTAEPYWQTLTVGEVLLAVGLIGVAYTAAVGGVSMARRGQPLSLTKLGQFLVDRFDFHLRPPSVFESARSAQNWFEWTSKGIAVPVLGAFLGLCACIVFSTGWLRPRETVSMIGMYTYMLLMVSPLVGWFLGSAGPNFNINAFTATRPMNDTELADRTLSGAAQSMCLGWMVWWIGSGLALGCAWFSGSAPTSPAKLFPLHVPPVTWLQASLYFAAFAGICLLTSWTLISLGVWTVLLRSWLFSAILYVGVSAAVGFACFQWSPSAAAILITLVCFLIASGNVFAFVAAYRLKLIGKTRIMACGCLYLALSTCVSFAMPRFLDLSSSLVGLQLTACLLPFTAFAATPLAFWWNRHR